MPQLDEPQPWRCPECGHYAVILYSPVFCKCGSVFQLGSGKRFWRWGDAVARVTSKLKITGSCGGCGKRQQQLNELGKKVSVQVDRTLGR